MGWHREQAVVLPTERSIYYIYYTILFILYLRKVDKGRVVVFDFSTSLHHYILLCSQQVTHSGTARRRDHKQAHFHRCFPLFLLRIIVFHQFKSFSKPIGMRNILIYIVFISVFHFSRLSTKPFHYTESIKSFFHHFHYWWKK